LIISVSEDFGIIVSCLGKVLFKMGNYIYIGSAKGCLEARLRRHLRKDKKVYWHIDYLLKSEKVQISQIWVINKTIECKTVGIFNRNFVGTMVKKGFGSSDCKCLSHLFYLKDRERTEKILEKKGFCVYYSFSNSFI